MDSSRKGNREESGCVSHGNFRPCHFRNLASAHRLQLLSRVGVSTIMNKTFSKSLLALAVGGLMVAGSAAAQTATTTSGAGPGVVHPGHPRVNQVNRREGRQQKRIANGIQNGKLNSQQAANLEKRETKLQNRQQADMAKHNGHLTKPEQKGLNRQENRISRSIYRDKHPKH
jgi:hypothetical protein